MALITAYWALGAFLAVLAFIVFAANPGRGANRALGALLLLDGAATVAFQLSREAPTDALARHYSAVAHWYFLPVSALMLYLALRLAGPTDPRVSRAILGLAAGATALGYGVLVASRSLADAPVDIAPHLGFRGVAIPDDLATWKLPHDLLSVFTPFVVLVLAARRATTATVSPFERRQAALTGLAFALYTGSSVGNAVVAVISALVPGAPKDDLVGFRGLLRIAYALLLAAILWALPRLGHAFGRGRARSALFVAVAVALVAGALAPYGMTALLDGLGLGNGRVLFIAAYAATLAVALVRYDLAGLSPAYRRALVSGSRAVLVVALAALPAVALFAWLGGSGAGFLVVGAVALGAVAVSPAPVRHFARRLAEAVFVTRDDPAAVAERARLYARALEGKEGNALEVRRRLDLSAREEEIVTEALARRQIAGRTPDLPDLVGRFVVERELGRGGAGVALLATDPVNGRRVVVKRYHTAGDRRRARQEAQALARAASPRVVRLLEIDDAGDEVLLVLDYAPGGSLQDLLDAGGPIPPRAAVAYAQDVLRGLEDLHRAGVVHRDLKPGNVVRDAEGRALIADFGAAGVEDDEPPMDATVTVARVVGSYATVSPEVLQGEEATPAADLYATGALLYRLLTRDDYVPLAGRTAAQARETILHGAPRLPHPLVPPSITPILATALAKDPGARHPSARAMREALAAADQRGW